jgi:hypothetical protein
MAKIEKRIDLPGSERTLLPGSRKIGPSDPKEQIQVTVFLRRGSSPKQFPDVEKIGKLPPAQRSHLSRAQFASRLCDAEWLESRGSQPPPPLRPSQRLRRRVQPRLRRRAE